MLVAVRTPKTYGIFKSRFPGHYRYENIDVEEGILVAAFAQMKLFVDSALQRQERILFYDETGNGRAAAVNMQVAPFLN